MAAIPDEITPLSVNSADARKLEEYIRYMREQINFTVANIERKQRELEKKINNTNGGT